MTVTQKYVGMRYVPKVEGEWNVNEEYENFSIVYVFDGATTRSYTSKVPVPIGVQITDENYWVETGNWVGNIVNLDSRMNVMDTQLGILQTENETQQSEIETLQQSVTTIAPQVATNKTDISNLKNNYTQTGLAIADIQSDINSLTPKIGTTTQRPTNLPSNTVITYYDTTLSKLVWWVGTKWINSEGFEI